MNSAVRIIKRSNEGLKQSQSDQSEKTRALSARDVASTIETWISEYKQQKFASISNSRKAWRTLGEKS